MLGKFNADGIKVECETDSSDLWIVDADGVYIEQNPLSSYMESECLDAINAKYGTNFSTLAMQKVTGIYIGDDCPDWNAYEKIELPIRKISANFPPNLFGYIEGVTAYLATSNGYSLIVNPENGEIKGTGPTIGGGFDTFVIEKLSNAGIEVTAAEGYDVTLVVGDTVPNWQEYERVIS